jgi:hypothetical protein
VANSIESVINKPDQAEQGISEPEEKSNELPCSDRNKEEVKIRKNEQNIISRAPSKYQNRYIMREKSCRLKA